MDMKVTNKREGTGKKQLTKDAQIGNLQTGTVQVMPRYHDKHAQTQHAGKVAQEEVRGIGHARV